jgi:hypothetical protein
LTHTVKPHVYYVPKENVAHFVEEFCHTDYLSLNSSYVLPVTDLPATITSFSFDGKTKSVYNYFAGPRELYELEKMIDRTAETNRWIDTSKIVDQYEVISILAS